MRGWRGLGLWGLAWAPPPWRLRWNWHFPVGNGWGASCFKTSKEMGDSERQAKTRALKLKRERAQKFDEPLVW